LLIKSLAAEHSIDRQFEGIFFQIEASIRLSYCEDPPYFEKMAF
jgi:hypothetical protein